MDDPVVNEIREAVESRSSAGELRIVDLHVWRVGKSSFACALTVITHDPIFALGESGNSSRRTGKSRTPRSRSNSAASACYRADMGRFSVSKKLLYFEGLL